MLKLFVKYKEQLTVLLLSSFFISLIVAPNDVNSKVTIILVLFSLCFFNLNNLKTYVLNNYPLIIFFFLISISLVYSDNINIGLNKIQRVSIIPASIFIFSFLTPSKKSTSIILGVFLATVLFATIYSHSATIINFMDNGESNFRNLFNLNYSYISLGNTVGLHPTYYAYYIICAIFVLLHILNRTTLLYKKIFLLFAVIYLSFFILHLSSRVAIVILYVVIIYNILNYTFEHNGSYKRVLSILIFHGFIFFMLLNIGVTKYRFQHIFGFTYYTGYTVNDSNHKLKLWNAALKANKNFWFGNGMGDIQTSLEEQFANAELTKPVAENYNSHNQYIEYYVGLGIIGFVAFCYMLFYYARIFLKNKNPIGFQFICVTAIMCLTECLFNRHQGVVFFVFFLGILWNLKRPEISID